MNKCYIGTFAFVLVVALLTPVSRSATSDVFHALASSRSSYAWKALVAIGAPGREITVDGKTENEGFTALTVRFGDRTIEGYMVGNHAFVTSPDRKWTDVPEMKPGESPTIFMDRMVRAVKLPATEIAELTRRSTNLREENGVLNGDPDDEAVKELLQRPGGRAAKEEGPSQAKGSLKVWTTNGIVTKYQYTLSRKQARDGKEVDLMRTVAVEIKDVGTTTVIVPERIKEKLRAKMQNQATSIRPE